MNYLYIFLSIFVLTPSIVQVFKEKKFRFRIFWSLVCAALIGLDIIGLLGSNQITTLQSQSVGFQNQLAETKNELSQTQSQLSVSEASTTALKNQIKNLQDQIAILPPPNRNALYDQSGQVVGLFTGELPQSIPMGTVLTFYLYNVNQISDGEVVTIYPGGKSVQLKSMSTLTGNGSTVISGAGSQSNLANGPFEVISNW